MSVCVCECGTGPKVSRKNCSTAFAAKLAPRRKVTKMKPRITLNRHLIIPRSSLLPALAIPRSCPCPSRWFQFNSLFTGRTTLCCAVKKAKKLKKNRKQKNHRTAPLRRDHNWSRLHRLGAGGKYAANFCETRRRGKTTSKFNYLQKSEGALQEANVSNVKYTYR